MTKLRFLFIVVIALFAFMARQRSALLQLTHLTWLILQNVGAVIGFYLDASERRKLQRAVCTPELGFAVCGNGVWTWTFKQNELHKAVEAPSGSAVLMAGAMGFPFIRLRAALPEELLAGSVAQSLGRRDGMSLAGLEEAREDNIAVMTQLRRSMSCFACGPEVARKQIPAFDDHNKGSDKPLTPPRAQSLVHTSLTSAAPYGGKPSVATFDYNDSLSALDLEEYTRPADPNAMVGTALMFAFLANQRVLPVSELSIRLSAAKHFFRGLRVPGIDHDFDSLLPKFMVLLGCEAGALTARAKWMQTARLWRLLLLQREDGSFGLTDSLGFALEAHEGKPPPAKRKERKGLAALATLCLGDGDLEDDLDDAADEAMDSSDDEASPPAADTKQAEMHQDERHKRVKDCPISFSAAAVRHRIPVALLELNSAYADPAMQRLLSRLTTRRGLRVTHLSGRIGEESMMLKDAQADAVALPDGPAATAVDSSEAVAEPAAVAAIEQRFVTNDAGSAAASLDAPRVPVERIWASMLCVQVLQGMDVSWLLDDEAEEGEERTIVDAAREWMEAQGKEDARVQALLDSGELAKAAEKTIEAWKKVQEQNIAELRKLDVLNRFTALTHFQRATGRVIKSIMTDHGALTSCMPAGTCSCLYASTPAQKRLQRSWTPTATSCAGSVSVRTPRCHAFCACMLMRAACNCSDCGHRGPQHTALLHLVLQFKRRSVLSGDPRAAGHGCRASVRRAARAANGNAAAITTVAPAATAEPGHQPHGVVRAGRAT